MNAGSAQPWSLRRRWFLIAMCVLSGCQLVGGDGSDEAGGDDLPAVDPNVTLGSAALTASCDSSGMARIANLSLQGGYDCDENFLVSMTSAGPDAGLIRMELKLAEVDSEMEGPVAGPTPDAAPICEDAGEAPSDGFRLDSVQTEGGSCQLGESTAVCDLEALSAGATVNVNLEICPAPQTATVTTEVVLGRLS